MIEAIYAKPVILVQPVLSTRFKYPVRQRDKLGEDNPNKWWHREEG